MDELKAKLIQVIMECYGGDYEDAEYCLKHILSELNECSGDMVLALISK